jgi:hypothetical protein
MKSDMARRQQKQKIRAIREELFGNLDPTDDMTRAARVRSLCPCEHIWTVPLWDIIFAACEDPSPLVREEALHVIEDAHLHGFSTAGGMGLLHAARRDPAPEVRTFVHSTLKQWPKLQRHKNRARDRLIQRALQNDDKVED